MGIHERKAREKTRRRGAILKAAKKLIAQSGVEDMSMNQLAEAVELNKATLYLYFGNKNDLIDAIVFEGLALLLKEIEPANRNPLDGRHKILHLIETMFAFYRKYPVYFYTMNHQERRKVHERLASPYSKKGDEKASLLFDTIAAYLEEGMHDGSIRKDIDIHTFLILFFAYIYGVTHTIYSKEDVYKDVLHLDSAMIERSAVEIVEYYLKRDE